MEIKERKTLGRIAQIAKSSQEETKEIFNCKKSVKDKNRTNWLKEVWTNESFSDCLCVSEALAAHGSQAVL